MKKVILGLSLIGVTLATPAIAVAQLPLQRVESSVSQTPDLGLDEQLWGNPGDRQALLTSIDNSLRYLGTPRAATVYRRYRVPGVTLSRVRRSLVRFRELVVSARSPQDLQSAVSREFVFYKSVGRDRLGTVGFTGYFEPVYAASRTRTEEYRYPLYRLPPDFRRWAKPHPTRLQLEGVDGLLGERSRLRGMELVWLRDRLEAFLVQVQGSARLQLPDNNTMTVGYAGTTAYSYTSIGGELVKDGKLPQDGLTLPRVIQYFRDSPEELDRYLPRNRSYVFFRDTNGTAATGSLGVPVTAERSIATDKSLMPPGALALINAPIPNNQLEIQQVSRYVLDQDTGGAIRGAGRVDIFMGTGQLAGDRAGLVNGTGELYYLLLRN